MGFRFFKLFLSIQQLDLIKILRCYPYSRHEDVMAWNSYLRQEYLNLALFIVLLRDPNLSIFRTPLGFGKLLLLLELNISYGFYFIGVFLPVSFSLIEVFSFLLNVLFAIIPRKQLSISFGVVQLSLDFGLF